MYIVGHSDVGKCMYMPATCTCMCDSVPGDYVCGQTVKNVTEVSCMHVVHCTSSSRWHNASRNHYTLSCDNATLNKVTLGSPPRIYPFTNHMMLWLSHRPWYDFGWIQWLCILIDQTSSHFQRQSECTWLHWTISAEQFQNWHLCWQWKSWIIVNWCIQYTRTISVVQACARASAGIHTLACPHP